VCSNGKRTSILENVAISVKKMSVFVVLHRWGTGTLFAQLVGWLVGWLIGHGTQGRQSSSKSNGNTETKGTSKQFIIIIIVVVVVVVERTGARQGRRRRRKDPNGIARSGRVFNGSGADGRTRATKEPIEEGERDQRQWRSRPRYF
jgi:hypothetical protein